LARLLPAIVVAAAVTAGLFAPASVATPAQKATRNLVVQPGVAKPTEKRLALVIGNNAYADAPLTNPVNDARAMAQALERAGFTVILRTDANQREMLRSVREFGSRLKGGGVGVFYYAGHGMQIKGRNYLIPVGTDIDREDEVAYQALDAQAVLDKMDSAGNGTNIMMLDACRNNPFARSFRSAQQGLAQMDAPVGTLVAFATAPGSIASDGQGRHGLYTSHLLSALEQPGLKVEEVFKQVRAAVRRDSQGRQVPWESTSLEGDFYFVAPAAAVPPVDPLAAVDSALWDTVKTSPHADVVRAYLERFPAGRHAADARERLANLQATPTATKPEPSPTLAGPVFAQDDSGRPPSDAVAGRTETTDAATPSPASSAGQPNAGMQPASTEDLEPQRLRAIEENRRRIAEIVRWGDLADAQRPVEPKRSMRGFTQGDRFRYRVIDRRRDEVQSEWGWRIDDITDDDQLIANGGAVRLDGVGQLLFSSDARAATWTEWKPPMQILAAAYAVGHRRELSGTLRRRDEQGRVSTTQYRGSMHVAAEERVTTPAGAFDTMRIDLTATGHGTRSDGARYQVYWRHTVWYAWRLGLWVAWDQDQHVDAKLDSRTRRELIAYDMARAPQGPQLANASR
jgi:hypothetical protein